MTELQTSTLLRQLHQTPAQHRSAVLQAQLHHYGLTDEEMDFESTRHLELFNLGIGRLNTRQLQNLLDFIATEINEVNLLKKLAFYEVEEQYQHHILAFFKQYHQGSISIDAVNLDSEFRGVQVASRDNFNTIIERGWTGDWDFQPANLDTQRVQVASMNETGPFPRGYYLNADIIDIQPISYSNQVRYRLFIANPQIVSTGNRNVKFLANPVSYK